MWSCSRKRILVEQLIKFAKVFRLSNSIISMLISWLWKPYSSCCWEIITPVFSTEALTAFILSYLFRNFVCFSLHYHSFIIKGTNQDQPNEETQRVRSASVLNIELPCLSPWAYNSPGTLKCSPTRKVHQASLSRNFIRVLLCGHDWTTGHMTTLNNQASFPPRREGIPIPGGWEVRLIASNSRPQVSNYMVDLSGLASSWT